MRNLSVLKNTLMAAAAGTALMSPMAAAHAGDIDFILNARLRAETVDLEGAANDAEAITLRTRFGLQGEFAEGFSFLIEGENVAHLVDDFNSTTNGNTAYPVVADPEETELNRLQLRYAHEDGYTFTLGRQRIIIGDARYVGNVGFRQNEQTFDAFVFTAQPAENLSLTYAYLDRVHRIFGDDHPFGELDLDAHAVVGAYEFEAGTLTGFAILADVEDLAPLSTTTVGVNWSGSFSTEGGPNWSYMLEWANQSDYADNPLSIDLNMFRGYVNVAQNGVSGRLGFELLEGNGTVGFTTPLATLHAYQGWADAFLATPGNGIRDIYVRAGYNFPEPPFGEGLNAAVVFHDYESESGGVDLGSEFDAVVTSRITDNVSLQLKAAFFDGGNTGPADRNKLWFAITYSR